MPFGLRKDKKTFSVRSKKQWTNDFDPQPSFCVLNRAVNQVLKQFPVKHKHLLVQAFCCCEWCRLPGENNIAAANKMQNNYGRHLQNQAECSAPVDPLTPQQRLWRMSDRICQSGPSVASTGPGALRGKEPCTDGDDKLSQMLIHSF